MDTWHELRVSRTAKSGILQVDKQRPVEGMAEVRGRAREREREVGERARGREREGEGGRGRGGEK